MATTYHVLHRLLRISRWIISLGYIAYAFYVAMHRADFVNSFGQPLRSTELLLFGLPMLAAVIGLAELAVKARMGGAVAVKAR